MDKKCVKALCRRALNGIEEAKALGNGLIEAKERALKDLMRATLVEPENKEVEALRTRVERELSDEKVERRVEKIREERAEMEKKAKEKKVNDNGDGISSVVDRLGLGMPPLPRGEVPPLPTGEVGEFHVVDEMMKKVAEGKINDGLVAASENFDAQKKIMSALADTLGVEADGKVTNGDVLRMAMEDSEENRVYLRTSGGLEGLCERLKMEDLETERAALFGVLAAAVEDSWKSKDMVYNAMGLAAALACLFQEVSGTESRSDKLTSHVFNTSFINANTSICNVPLPTPASFLTQSILSSVRHA